MGVVILSGRGDFCVGVSILIIRIFHLSEWAQGQRCSDNRGSTVLQTIIYRTITLRKP